MLRKEVETTCHRIMLQRWILFLIPGVFWIFIKTAAAADQPTSSVLHLTNGDFVSGRLRGSQDPNILRWDCPYFTTPFEFPLKNVHAAYYSLLLVKPQGEFCFVLANDDVLFGDLVSLTDDLLEIQTGRAGRIYVRREHVRRFYRRQQANAIYLGPNGLDGWKERGSSAQWRDEGGRLATDQYDASLYRDFGIPAKAIFEFELSWKKKPDFLFALGVDERDAAIQRGFRFEVWDDDFAAVGESKKDADAASLQRIKAGEGRVRVQAYLDQEAGRLTVLSDGGRILANLKIDPPNRKIHKGVGVRLVNKKGDVRLDHLRILRWNGQSPSDVRAESRVQRADGSIVYGTITAFDPQKKQFTIRKDKTVATLDQNTIREVVVSPSSSGVPSTVEPIPSPAVCIAYHDGTQLSGNVTRIDDGVLSLISPVVKDPMLLPLTELRSLVKLRHQDRPAPSANKGRSGRLELEEVRLHGRLVDAKDQADASCLVWRPDLACNASALKHGIMGRIVYRDPPPKPTVAKTQVVRPEASRGFGQFLWDALTGKEPPLSVSRGRKSLHLRSGDTIPCEVDEIDEKGLRFKTPLSDSTFVTHDKIKSVELVATPKPPRLAKTKRARLLTLPRMQRDAPPTHLICSKNGDFLRGRILEMDEKQLKVELRLETKEIPRDRVAQIIWLHRDELLEAKKAAVSRDIFHPIRVQALRSDDNRVTFRAKKLEGETLFGVSDVLGNCRADLADVDQLLFGAYIEQSAARLAYQRWKLHHAPDPLFIQAENGATEVGSIGKESELVGRPAFAFKLDMLDGRTFKLADRKGKIVVLDFWATWCGPCLQTLPLVHDVVREFSHQGVELMALNMEEQPEQIKDILERHKLKIPVPIDRDGIVAIRYNVTAIPQTVVIDRDGKIDRIFVGGGKKMAETLKKVLQGLTQAEATPAKDATR